MLTAPPSPGRRAWVAWGVALALGVAVIAALTFVIDRLAQRHLTADAERHALNWARHIENHVSDIEHLFEGELPGAETRDHLGHMLGTAGLFRFKLFSPGGRLLIVSDALDRHAGESLQKPADAERARRAAGQGLRHIEMSTGDGIKRPPLYTEAYVPVHRAGRVIGVVEVYIDQTELAATTRASFRQAALAAGLALAGCLAAGALLWRWRARREQQVHERVNFLAHHDALTGTLNHASFGSELERACREAAERGGGQPGLAVLCIDIDHFSAVNDAHGHHAGDELLRQAAARLQAVLRGGDLLARLAGDRFAVLQRGADDAAAVPALAQRVVEQFAQPFRLQAAGGELTAVTCSVGAAVLGADGTDADALLHRAEGAVQQAKARGSARWSFFDADAERALHERRALAADLRDALARGALQLHFQPLWGGCGQRLLGYEALARWPHPVRGFVPPLDFVAVAEATGQIEALGGFVLDRACAEAARWPGALSVAVNLSPAQFRAGNGSALVERVRGALADSGLAPSRLELEITESLLMSHTDDVLATLHALRALGVRIAMDDFGTGYSSLAYLWRFPFDKLKIDRAFTQGLGSDPKVGVIVDSIVSMAHSLSIRVNAEGVETDAQRDALARHGCDELQGYLLGRPQPVERLTHGAEAVVAA